MQVHIDVWYQSSMQVHIIIVMTKNAKTVLSAKMTWFVTKFLSGGNTTIIPTITKQKLLSFWQLYNTSLNAAEQCQFIFCHNPNTIHESAQPCSGFANQQMFFRAAKSARPWSSPEPLKKGLFCLPLFDKFCQAGRPAARPAQRGSAGLPARAPPRGVQRNFDSQKLVLSDPDLIISLQQMSGQI